MTLDVLEYSAKTLLCFIYAFRGS